MRFLYDFAAWRNEFVGSSVQCGILLPGFLQGILSAACKSLPPAIGHRPFAIRPSPAGHSKISVNELLRGLFKSYAIHFVVDFARVSFLIFHLRMALLFSPFLDRAELKFAPAVSAFSCGWIGCDGCLRSNLGAVLTISLRRRLFALLTPSCVAIHSL